MYCTPALAFDDAADDVELDSQDAAHHRDPYRSSSPSLAAAPFRPPTTHRPAKSLNQK